MPRVEKSRLPPASRLWARKQPGDFLDCYVVGSDMAPRQAAQVIVTFPAWARALLILRATLTAPFGLSNDGPQAADKVGPFPVEHETRQELVAGFNDRHLDFRVSVFAQDGTVSLATWVHPHHLGGRIYLAVIYPFHVLIAKNALRRVAKTARAHVTG